jgi:hypothetical protein
MQHNPSDLTTCRILPLLARAAPSVNGCTCAPLKFAGSRHLLESAQVLHALLEFVLERRNPRVLLRLCAVWS